MISVTLLSQKTGFVSCFFMRGAMSVAGSWPGRMGSAEAFIQTVCMGVFMLGRTSSMAAESLSCAGCIRGVWKAPAVLRTLACMAPAFSAMGCRKLMAFSVPPTDLPLGKRWLEIWQTAPSPSFFLASSQSGFSLASSRPATESISCLPICAASCMASPRSFTNFSASSKLRTPAAQSAVYSPRDRPAITEQRLTASGLSAFSFSTPARPAMNIAGWQYLVSSSFSSGPLRQRSSTSHPRMSFAFSSISFTAGMSFVDSIMPTYWEPWPGKKSATGSGASLLGPTSVGGGCRTLLSVLTARSLPGSLMLTQPTAGPVPSSSLKLRRSPFSSTSSIRAPVERRSAVCGDAVASPSRTRIPPLSAPPTTSHL
mmetsp:Transcript_122959/g.348513  ORF Transcript_122959/g.348513 Transcript_122959/m.348513 type:complete len:370 (-) Transcript_122959:89-1198(-)